MPDTSDLRKEFNVVDVKEGDIIKFVDNGIIETVDFKKGKGNQDILKITIQLPNGKEKVMVINKTSNKNLSAAYGTNTDNWVDKQAKITILQSTFGPYVVLKPIE